MKIIHRIIPTNAWLFKCGLKNTQNCTFCEVNTETIEHLFWECQITKSLWLQLSEWLENITNQKFKFDSENTILGNPGEPIFLQHIKLITKQFIYTQKIKEVKPNLIGKHMMVWASFKPRVPQSLVQDFSTTPLILV